MANALIGYSNKIDTATLSGGSWSTASPLDNLKSSVLSLLARSTDATTASTKFDADLGAAVSVGVVALVNTNATTAGQYRIRGSAVADFSTTVVDTGWLDCYPAGVTEAGLEGYTRAILHTFRSHYSARYWRIEFDDATNADGYVELGRVFVGPYWQPSFNMIQGASLSWIDRDEVGETDSGVEYFSERADARLMTFDLRALPEAEAMESAFELQRLSRISREVVFMFNPDDTAHRLRRSFLGRLRSRKPMAWNGYRRVDASFEIKEIVGASGLSASGSPGTYTPGSGAAAYDIGCFIAGKPDAGEVVMRFVAVRAFSLPASLTGSEVDAGTAATGAAVFSVKKNGTEIGTLTMPSTFAAATSTSFAAGDVLSIVGPLSQDATLADISITIKGARA